MHDYNIPHTNHTQEIVSISAKFAHDPVALRHTTFIAPDLSALRSDFAAGYRAGREDGEALFEERHRIEGEKEREFTLYLWEWMMEPSQAIPWRIGYICGFVEADTEHRMAVGSGPLIQFQMLEKVLGNACQQEN